MNFLTKLLEVYNKGLKYDKDTKTLNLLLAQTVAELDEKEEAMSLILDENLLLNNLVIELDEETTKTTDLDAYLSVNARKIPNIAYKSKRNFKGKDYTVFINELITRDAFEVMKLTKQLKLRGKNLTRAKKIGDKVSKLLTWSDDKKLIKTGDYYVMPNESLAYRKVDCEDHALLNASLDVEIGVVYGFFNGGGHAWNCVVQDNKLYYLETTGNVGRVILAKNAKEYDGRFIVTKDNTYTIGSMVNFGEIARL